MKKKICTSELISLKYTAFWSASFLWSFFLSKLSTVKDDTRFPGKQITLRLLQIIFLNITKQWGEPDSDENELSEVNLLELIYFFHVFQLVGQIMIHGYQNTQQKKKKKKICRVHTIFKCFKKLYFVEKMDLQRFSSVQTGTWLKHFTNKKYFLHEKTFSKIAYVLFQKQRLNSQRKSSIKSSKC